MSHSYTFQKVIEEEGIKQLVGAIPEFKGCVCYMKESWEVGKALRILFRVCQAKYLFWLGVEILWQESQTLVIFSFSVFIHCRALLITSLSINPQFSFIEIPIPISCPDNIAFVCEQRAKLFTQRLQRDVCFQANCFSNELGMFDLYAPWIIIQTTIYKRK